MPGQGGAVPPPGTWCLQPLLFRKPSDPQRVVRVMVAGRKDRLAMTIQSMQRIHGKEDFSFLPELADRSSPFFHAVDALGIHEPLRNAESVPAAALATGKPIWSR